jgi:hypothetical protein
MKLDLLSIIGKESCEVASHVTQALSQGGACSSGQYWDAGWITLGLLVLGIFAIYHSRREQRRRDNYLL